MKQAYLIIAHNKIEQLKFLASLLDYKKHDIYILFDKKAQINREMKEQIESVVKESTLYFYKRDTYLLGRLFSSRSGVRII